jgi:hypothetical protein
VASVFQAAMLHDLTSGFDPRLTVQHGGGALRRLSFRGQGLRALLAVAIITWTAAGAAGTFVSSGLPEPEPSVQLAAEFLNTTTRADALIEASSHELFFLLDRPYHYPPDEVNLRVIEAMIQQQVLPTDYDPLAADPDYLVVNWAFPSWIVYNDIIKGSEFRSLRRFGPYQIYERVR